VLEELKVPQEQTESRHNKNKSHQGQASANSCKESLLGSQSVAQVRRMGFFR
jgi:hypothetical protein